MPRYQVLLTFSIEAHVSLIHALTGIWVLDSVALMCVFYGTPFTTFSANDVAADTKQRKKASRALDLYIYI